MRVSVVVTRGPGRSTVFLPVLIFCGSLDRVAAKYMQQLKAIFDQVVAYGQSSRSSSVSVGVDVDEASDSGSTFSLSILEP